MKPIKPDWISGKDWQALTDRQRRTMIEKGAGHLGNMNAWIRAAKNPRKSSQRRNPAKPKRLPRRSQWFNPPDQNEIRERKEDQY